jgi:glycine/D-amino acid oxidase-like deaminating enzyme
VLVVGAGAIGLMAAWRLALAGYRVSVVDPALALEPGQRTPSGSQAALGVLMANVFQRSTGRSWRLRQRSHALWGQWLAELEGRGHPLRHQQGLLLLAASREELERQERLAADRARLGLPLGLLGPDQLAALSPALPATPLGGLYSADDGQIDPGPLLNALLEEVRRSGCDMGAEAAVAVERGPASGGRRWRVHLAGGGEREAHWLVLALGLETAGLLSGLGHPLQLEPVLGQALELELPAGVPWSWPAVVVWRGMNLVNCGEQADGSRRLWLGATLEPGCRACPQALAALRQLGGEAPPWLREARVVRQWQGLRVRPVGQPAPVLAEPEPGLLVATGHYRNGVLLAPATAEWLVARVQGAAVLQQAHLKRLA